MVFSNLIFLYLFLPVCLIAYFFCPGIRAKNAVLILFSLIFYAWGEPVYLLLMIASAAVNWYFGLLIERRRKKIFLILALVLDLGCLAVFKYAGFFVENLNAVFGASIPVPQIALPIGISFYTFQALSYTVDVWRGDVPAQRSFAKLLLYISLFPQLIAGPIVRYSDVAAQIDDRQFDASEAFYGATRFCIGLAKKVLLADAAGKVASQILDGSLASNTTVAAWLGILLYTFEIYFDFSGYSDMAIGMAKLFGFDFDANFDHPYLSASLTEFWRRWHISLGRWFRDYVYIPLGGSRVSTPKCIRNLLIVWVLTGLWHGASWTFVAWGLYHGILLLLEKYPLKGILAKTPSPILHILTLLAVIVGWVLFFSPDFSSAIFYLGRMFGAGSRAFWDSTAKYYFAANWKLLVLGILGCGPWIRTLYRHLVFSRRSPGLVLSALLLIGIFLLCVPYMTNATYQSFLYAQF